MRRLYFYLLALVLCGGPSGAQVTSELVSPPTALPMGEGLFRIASAEPLGKGGLYLRYSSEAYQISVRKVGEGTSLTGHLGLAYGLGNSVDFGLAVPVMFDVAGGLAKYGSGDITTTLKFGFPSKFPSSHYFGFDLSVLHAYGFKGRTALNVRPYSREGREISSRLLWDLNMDAIGFRANLGYLFTAVTRDPGLMYGMAVEIGRGQVFTMTGEYWNEPSALGGQTRRAVLGARMNLWRLKLEAGVEKGLTNDLPNVTAVAGIRLDPKLGRGHRRDNPSIVRKPKDMETSIRVAVVNLAGFEQQHAGELVAQEIKNKLTRYGHIRLIDVGADARFLDPDTAVRLAQEANVDVVITGRVLRYEMDRASKPNLPLVVGLPQTRALLAADIRVVDRRNKGNVLSFSLTGTGQQNRGIRMFPTSGDDRTSYLSALDKQRVWTEAIVHMLNDLFEGMHDNFEWFPG
jgi:hypothetical protein